MIRSAARIAYVIGARPNFVKMAPVIAEMRRRAPQIDHVVVHTGQHYDSAMSQVFLDELGVPEPDHLLGVGSGSQAVQTARIMERIEPVFEADPPDLVVLPGDVNSTLAAALVAAKLGIRIAHVESGLRSYDRSMPEEINRFLTDGLADLLFVHCEDAVENLAREGIRGDHVIFTGNTMIDSLVAVEPRFAELCAARAHGLQAGEYLLVTLHRPALVDGPLLTATIDRLAEVARRLPVLFPAHPRTQKALEGVTIPAGLHIVGPLGYLDFLSLERDAAGVLTDSGGVQEETTYMGVPCFTLRDNTERPVTITHGTNTLLGMAPERIGDVPRLLEYGVRRPAVRPPLWDGRAAERLADGLDRMGLLAGASVAVG
jgi:UDP-N-acetylglucosamine 2-epimerase (non-hydrolysing)